MYEYSKRQGSFRVKKKLIKNQKKGMKKVLKKEKKNEGNYKLTSHLSHKPASEFIFIFRS